MPKIIMIQGTSSGSGKSFITLAICRFLKKKGFDVCPFKAQNMSLNAVAAEDGEMAWAQFVQALACGINPSVLMNPVLLKPVGNSKSELIIMGKSTGFVHSATFDEYRKKAKPKAYEALRKLLKKHQVVVAEGAGSPVEVNIKRNDFVNMMLAKTFKAPVFIVADIERGGVFAQIIGTMSLLTRKEKELVSGFIINKFRGNLDILKPGLSFIEKKTRKKVLGVIPYMENILPPEDSLDIRKKVGKIKIAVIKYPRISNFSDIMPLWVEDVEITWVTEKEQLEGAKLIILPGSRKVLDDLRWLKRKILHRKILEMHQRGVFILGICGGFQMLHEALHDPLNKEGGGTEEGLKLIPGKIVFSDRKIVKNTTAYRIKKECQWIPDKIEGYLIKSGRIESQKNPLFEIEEEKDGYCKRNLLGTHLHNILMDDNFREALLLKVGIKPSGKSYKSEINKTFDKMAEIIEDQKKLSKRILQIVTEE